MSDETTLLPCPFCGGEAETHETIDGWIAACSSEQSELDGFTHKAQAYGATEAEAIAAWNTRAPVENDGWFYLPKPKESIVQYGEQRTEKTEHGYKVTQPVEVIEGAIRSWSDELGEYIMKRICEAWNARTHGTLTAEQVRKAIFNGSSYASYDGATYYADGIGMQAIADELNAELGGGNCARCAEDMGRYADSLCDPLKERIAELLRCLENDWHIHASWDGPRKFWCIELTEDGVRVRDAELGSEFVECGICKFYHADIQLCEYGIPPCSKFERNELNARAERTCEMNEDIGVTQTLLTCSECGYTTRDYRPIFCGGCGARIRKKVDA